MPKYSYVAMDSRGKETKGTLDVSSQNEAINRLKEMGYFPTKVVEDKGKAKKGGKTSARGKKKGGWVHFSQRKDIVCPSAVEIPTPSPDQAMMDGEWFCPTMKKVEL